MQPSRDIKKLLGKRHRDCGLGTPRYHLVNPEGPFQLDHVEAGLDAFNGDRGCSLRISPLFPAIKPLFPHPFVPQNHHAPSRFIAAPAGIFAGIYQYQLTSIHLSQTPLTSCVTLPPSRPLETKGAADTIPRKRRQGPATAYAAGRLLARETDNPSQDDQDGTKAHVLLYIHVSCIYRYYIHVCLYTM